MKNAGYRGSSHQGGPSEGDWSADGYDGLRQRSSITFTRVRPARKAGVFGYVALKEK